MTYKRQIKSVTQKDLDRYWSHVDIQGADDIVWPVKPGAAIPAADATPNPFLDSDADGTPD